MKNHLLGYLDDDQVVEVEPQPRAMLVKENASGQPMDSELCPRHKK